MDDLDAVDYSEDPLEGVSIRHSTYSASVGMYSSGFSRNYPSYSYAEPSRSQLIVLPDDPPTWSLLSTPPHSPATLGFVTDCISPNLGLDLLVSKVPPR